MAEYFFLIFVVILLLLLLLLIFNKITFIFCKLILKILKYQKNKNKKCYKKYYKNIKENNFLLRNFMSFFWLGEFP